ncbi:hypothetical protein [Streptomyces subrutilus]|uniref:Uncharacterized protein n=1 Tax=Streptomyces subrutilus TaxID=36818 RepID=A0A1E5PKN9_9ACTN|nr:hypothetical protein [Streptomyces subrutilus]OEJ30090.1 hypothetical protein BGK67_00725 [Streptomyces subrutilus]
MNNTRRALAAAAFPGTLFAFTVPAHAAEGPPTTEGHKGAETDISYNTHAQVIGFDVKLPTNKASGPGYSE